MSKRACEIIFCGVVFLFVLAAAPESKSKSSSGYKSLYRSSYTSSYSSSKSSGSSGSYSGNYSGSSSKDEWKCIKDGCNNNHAPGSKYCFTHMPDESIAVYYSKGSSNSKSSSSIKSSSHSSKKKSSYQDAYDDGYNSIYEDEDYEWDRYQKDDDYARGVDDAMEDCYDDFGDDW